MNDEPLYPTWWDYLESFWRALSNPYVLWTVALTLGAMFTTVARGAEKESGCRIVVIGTAAKVQDEWRASGWYFDCRKANAATFDYATDGMLVLYGWRLDVLRAISHSHGVFIPGVSTANPPNIGSN